MAMANGDDARFVQRFRTSAVNWFRRERRFELQARCGRDGDEIVAGRRIVTRIVTGRRCASRQRARRRMIRDFLDYLCSLNFWDWFQSDLGAFSAAISWGAVPRGRLASTRVKEL